MTQIENILDDEIEVMKTKCENSEVDFLFVLDGSGDRIDDSKESVLRYHIRESHFGLIWKDSRTIPRGPSGLNQRASKKIYKTVQSGVK